MLFIDKRSYFKRKIANIYAPDARKNENKKLRIFPPRKFGSEISAMKLIAIKNPAKTKRENPLDLSFLKTILQEIFESESAFWAGAFLAHHASVEYLWRYLHRTKLAKDGQIDLMNLL